MKHIGLTLAALLVTAFAAPTTAYGQAPGECADGFCGTPNQHGGGCGCGGGGSILVNNTDLGETYSTSDDFDGDGYEDDFDNCPFITNRDQVDGDGDQVGDGCDNAPARPNLDQLDIDGDGVGDAADLDIDEDGFTNELDNCVRVYNPTQRKTVASAAVGDACNPDDDADGILDIEDACPKISGTAQVGTCDEDEDLDGILDASDNCPSVSNADKRDIDNDGTGDLCDVDMDNDGIANNLDNAKEVVNPQQEDKDRDGLGDVVDNEFCYVFDRSALHACLSPDDTFKVGAIAIDEKAAQQLPTTGSDLKLVFFANRINTPIEYTWTVAKAPKGSTATVQASVGKVTTSMPGTDTFQYAQAKTGNNVAPTFVADEPGEYELKLVAKLMFADEVITDGPQVATYVVKLTAAEGSAGNAGGCTTVKGAGMSSLLLVALGFLAMRRRS